MRKILFTGGTGRLAAEIKYLLPDIEYVGIENWDFTYPIKKGESEQPYDLIIHAGAYTDVRKAEKEKDKCFQTNAYGTFNMVNTYKDIPFVYISTEWADKPLGVYALSKRLGEEIVKTHPRHLILRTLFKPDPFPFPYAYEDQWTNGDYVNVIAEVMVKLIDEWDKKTCKLIYAGTGRKTIFELARRTRPDVKPNKVEDYNKQIGMNLVPHDYVPSD